MTPSMGSINLLQPLTELKKKKKTNPNKTQHLLDYQLIIKEYNLGETDGQAMENEPGASMSSLGMPLPDISTCSPTQMLSELCPSGILWRLHYIGTIGYIIGHWALIPSPAPPASLGVGLKVPGL